MIKLNEYNYTKKVLLDYGLWKNLPLEFNNNLITEFNKLLNANLLFDLKNNSDLKLILFYLSEY